MTRFRERSQRGPAQPSFRWTFFNSLACCSERSETTTGLNKYKSTKAQY